MVCYDFIGLFVLLCGSVGRLTVITVGFWFWRWCWVVRVCLVWFEGWLCFNCVVSLVVVCWFCRWLYLGGEFLVVGLGLYLVCCSFVVICFVVVFAVCCWYWLMSMFRLIDFI